MINDVSLFLGVYEFRDSELDLGTKFSHGKNPGTKPY
jgi:hypothetical protein